MTVDESQLDAESRVVEIAVAGHWVEFHLVPWLQELVRTRYEDIEQQHNRVASLLYQWEIRYAKQVASDLWGITNSSAATITIELDEQQLAFLSWAVGFASRRLDESASINERTHQQALQIWTSKLWEQVRDDTPLVVPISRICIEKILLPECQRAETFAKMGIEYPNEFRATMEWAIKFAPRLRDLLNQPVGASAGQGRDQVLLLHATLLDCGALLGSTAYLHQTTDDQETRILADQAMSEIKRAIGPHAYGLPHRSSGQGGQGHISSTISISKINRVLVWIGVVVCAVIAGTVGSIMGDMMFGVGNVLSGILWWAGFLGTLFIAYKYGP